MLIFTLFGYFVRGKSPKGLVHSLLMQFFTLGSSKIQVSETYSVDILTTHIDHPGYVKHDLGGIHVFFTIFGYLVGGGGVPKGLVHNPLLQFFTMGSAKIKLSKTYVSDIATTHNDHPSYGKHVLATI